MTEREEQDWPTLLAAALTAWAQEVLDEDLPPEFWAHLRHGMREIGEALRIYTHHARDALLTDPLSDAYEKLMEGDVRVGKPAQREDSDITQG